MNYLDDLLFWVNERERIRIKKNRGDPQPWTDDPILQEYRFCNVHREDDKVTQWIRDNWLRPNQHRPTLPFAACVARMVNLPETLEELGYPHKWDPNHFIEILKNRKERGEKVWTSAYMITGGFSKGGESKEVIIARVLSQAHENLMNIPIIGGDTLAGAAEKIKCSGIGTFLSAQVVADLKYLEPLHWATDWHTWCAPGPGSTMGLNFLHGRNPLTSINADQFIKEVNQVRSIISSSLNTTLCAQNTQNCLCEFSKYVRAKHFNKRLKTKYRP